MQSLDPAFNPLFLESLPSSAVLLDLVVDRNYRLLTATEMARRLLGLREIIPTQDFLHTVRGIPYNTIWNAIDLVFRANHR